MEESHSLTSCQRVNTYLIYLLSINLIHTISIYTIYLSTSYNIEIESAKWNNREFSIESPKLMLPMRELPNLPSGKTNQTLN